MAGPRERLLKAMERVLLVSCVCLYLEDQAKKPPFY